MFPAAFALLKISAVLFLVGFPLHVVLTPRFLRQRGLEPWLCVFYGFSLLPLCCVWAFTLGLDIKYGFYAALALPTLLSCWLLILRRELLARELRALHAAFSGWAAPEAIAALACAGLLLSPLIGTGYATSPFRFGPDIAQYCAMAQYLLDGGTYERLNSFWTPVNTGAWVLQQSFLTYFRWGVSFEIAGMARLSGYAQEASRVAFAGLLIPYALGSAFVYALVRRFAPRRAAFWLACAFALNGNLINVYYESFWGQICALPALVFCYLLLAELRSDEGRDSRIIAAGAFCLASLTVLYSEAVLFFLLVFAGAVCCCDLLLQRRLRLSWLRACAATAVFAGLPLLPCLPHIYNNYISSTGLIGAGGGAWWQPLWAWPSEIVGFTSIYGKLRGFWEPLSYNQPITRGWADALLNGLVSLLLVWLFGAYVLRAKKADRPFYLAPVLLTTAALAFLLLRHSHNYLYFKVYTLFLPLFLAALAAAYHERAVAAVSGRAAALFIACVLASGMLTIAKYYRQRGYIGPALYDLHAFVGRQVLLRPSPWDGAFFAYLEPCPKKKTPWQLPHPAEHAMFDIMRVNWLSRLALKTEQDIAPFLGLRTMLLVRRGGPCGDPAPKPPARTIYSNAGYLLVESGRTLSSFMQKADAAPYEPDFSSALVF